MTRYQCIKNFPPFQAGKVYIGSEPDNRSNRGRILMNVSSEVEPVFVTISQLSEYFTEVQPIVPDPYNDHEAEQYVHMLPSRSRVIGCLIMAGGFILTLIAIAFTVIKYRS